MSARVRLAALCVTGGFLLGVLLGQDFTGTVAAIPAPKIIIVEKVRVLGVKDFARSLLTAKSFTCLDYILTRESNWRPKARNRDSGASGLAQFIPATWQSLGYLRTTDGNAQVVAALVYIANRYGSGGPCAAKKFWQRNGYY
jgi:hypothetical protein